MWATCLSLLGHKYTAHTRDKVYFDVFSKNAALYSKGVLVNWTETYRLFTTWNAENKNFTPNREDYLVMWTSHLLYKASVKWQNWISAVFLREIYQVEVFLLGTFLLSCLFHVARSDVSLLASIMLHNDWLPNSLPPPRRIANYVKLFLFEYFRSYFRIENTVEVPATSMVT